MKIAFTFVLFTAAVLAQLPSGLSTSKRITQYRLDTWQEVQGLKHNSIISLAQSSDGYVWLATYAELYRFDGVSFKNYEMPLDGAQPRVLFQDSQERMWIGTTNGLISYSRGTFSRMDLPTAPRSTISAITELHDGTILFGTPGGLLSFDGSRFHDRSMEYDVAGSNVWSITETSDGEVWVGTNKGVRRKTSSYVEQIDTTSGSLKHNIVRSIIEDRFGNIWIGTAGGGITRYRNGVFSTFTTGDGLPSNVIRILFEDRNGSVWIGSSGGGLSRYLNGRFETLTSVDGLTTDVIWALCQDREGSLWIGTGGGGLNRLRDSRFTALTKKEGIGNNFLWTVYEDNRGVQWIGTNGGGVTLWENGTAKVYTVGTTPLSNIVRSILDDKKGTIWIGTSDGVFYSRSQPPHAFQKFNPIGSKTIFSITQTKDNTVWFGTQNDGVYALDVGTRRATQYTTENGLRHNTVRAITEHPDGSLWFGTDSGITVLTTERKKIWKPFQHNAVFVDDEIRDIYIDADSVVWVGSDKGSLRRFQGGRMMMYGPEQGYDAIAVHEIQEDDLGYLWLSCNKGIFRANKKTLNDIARGATTTAEFTLYGIVDGMGSSECNGGNQPAGWKMRNGTIWFPTMKGVTIVSPQKLPTNTIVPPVYIEEIVADGATVESDGSSASLAAGSNRVTITYSALSMLAPELVRFKYQLEGHDNEWIDGRNSRSVSYTNLAPGTYTFRVIAANNDGVWNYDGASITIMQEPYFYQTSWFGISVMLLVTGVIFSAYRVRINVLKTRERELKNLVAERTHNLQIEKERAEQANQFKSDLVNIVAHDLKNPLTTIVGMSHFLLEEELNKETVADSAKAISGSAEQMVDLITDFLNVESMEQGKINLNKVSLSLSELTQYVVSMNKHLAEKKQQKLQVTACDPAESMISGDSERLYQSIENILSNAVKYSPFGAPIEIRVERKNGAVRVAVKDYGAGLSEDDQKKLFGKFQKLSPRPTGNETSNGLGLSIVKLIVELHGGKVWAESMLGEGSTFYIELPAENATA